MPFLFWMPMIVMCGLWRAAKRTRRRCFPRALKSHGLRDVSVIRAEGVDLMS